MYIVQGSQVVIFRTSGRSWRLFSSRHALLSPPVDDGVMWLGLFILEAAVGVARLMEGVSSLNQMVRRVSDVGMVLGFKGTIERCRQQEAADAETVDL